VRSLERRWSLGIGGLVGVFVAAAVLGSTTAVGAARTPKLGGKIAFYSDRDGPFDIYVMKADGTGTRRLTTSKPKGAKEQAALWPRWSPEGKRIVFQSGAPQLTEGQIYVMNADGSGKRRLTSPSQGDNILPAWSPKGSRIAFVSGRDGYARVYAMDARGRNQRPLTPKGLQGAFPTWAPDGKKLAFGCPSGGKPAICTVTVPGERVTTIWKAPAGFGVLGLDWSPDGRRILLMGGPGQTPDVYVVGATGKGLRRLTTDPANDSYPAWSPDGHRIVFSSNRSGGTELYVMNPDGSGQTRLTNKSGHDEAPDWARGNR
jgi:Tol biopolymer transport system component